MHFANMCVHVYIFLAHLSSAAPSVNKSNRTWIIIAIIIAVTVLVLAAIIAAVIVVYIIRSSSSADSRGCSEYPYRYFEEDPSYVHVQMYQKNPTMDGGSKEDENLNQF